MLVNDSIDNNGTFTPIYPAGSEALGINDADQVVGYYGTDGGLETFGFLYSGGTYTSLGDPFSTGDTEAWGINDASEIVGTYGDATGLHGFLDNGGVFTSLDDPTATGFTFPQAINNLGQIVGSTETRAETTTDFCTISEPRPLQTSIRQAST